MAKKMNFRNDMREAKNAKDSVEEAERLPTEKGYTRAAGSAHSALCLSASS